MMSPLLIAGIVIAVILVVLATLAWRALMRTLDDIAGAIADYGQDW